MLASGCAETRLAAHAIKSIREPAPQSQGGYKVGQPYQVSGAWYYPEIDEAYDETGIASWYGDAFHLKPTANGEIFDMHRVSAAHKTLPLPSVVQVTNLENGRSLQIRINDRGPFVNGRIIDLSRRAAELLGTLNQGTAKVRVQYLKPESDHEIALARGLRPGGTPGEILVAANGSGPVGRDAPAVVAVSSSPVHQEQLAIAPEPIVIQTAADPNARIFVQAGAFAEPANASRLQQALSAFGRSAVTPVDVSGRTLYRVRVGPVPSVEEGDRLLAEIIGRGNADARLVVAD